MIRPVVYKDRFRWAELWSLFLLCLLGGSRWLVEQALPATRSSDSSAALGCVIAIAALVLHRGLRTFGSAEKLSYRSAWRRWVGGTAVFGIAATSRAVAGRQLHESDAALALGIGAVVVALLTAMRNPQVELSAYLWPGLAGFTGLALLVPEPDLSSWRYDVALAGLGLGMGAAVFFASGADSKEAPLADSSFRVPAGQLLGGAILLGAICLIHEVEGLGPTVSTWAVLLDGGTAWLTVITLTRVGPLRFTSQFFLVPLLALLESLGLLRPRPDLRVGLSLTLLAAGGLALMIFREPEGVGPLLDT